jgi:purine-binding chemotaxis protein CheW
MNNKAQSAEDTLLVASFNLGGGAFGIDAQQVQEVAKVGDITQVHHAPPDVVGIRNLRGRIVTVLDLRARLRLGVVSPSPANRVLIVDWHGEPVGLLVDSVGDIFSTPQRDLLPPPPNLNGVQSRNLRGVCQGSGRLVALLDHAELLRAEEGSSSSPNRVTT